MPPRDRSELNFYKIYSEMLAEAEMLLLTKKVRRESLDSNDGGSAAVEKTKEQVEKERQELEKSLSDDKLCQICFTRELDTQMIPCLHQTCQTCIQTIIINTHKCPYCNE